MNKKIKKKYCNKNFHKNKNKINLKNKLDKIKKT